MAARRVIASARAAALRGPAQAWRSHASGHASRCHAAVTEGRRWCSAAHAGMPAGAQLSKEMEALVQQIHATPTKAVVYAAGGGAQARSLGCLCILLDCAAAILDSEGAASVLSQ